MTVKIVIAFLISLAIQIIAEKFYHEPMNTHSLSENGILSVQNKLPKFIHNLLDYQSTIGSGKELIIASFLMLIWGPRSKFVYYMFLLAAIELFSPIFKLIYTGQRPYLIEPRI